MAFTDNFNRASLGANWATVEGTAWVTVSSLYLKPGGQYQTTGVRVVGTFPETQYAEVWTEVPSAAGDAASGFGPAVRMRASGDCYFAGLGLTTIYLYKHVNGISTYLGEGVISISADTLTKVKLVVTGTSLEVFVGDVSKATLTDASIAAGNPGCHALTGETATLPRFDDFSSTDASTAAVSPNTTRDILTKPTLPSLSAAGFRFVDPTFGSRIVRVTDGNATASIEAGYLNGSYRTPSASHQRMWNSASTKFFVERTDAAKFLYSWDASTMTATLVERLLFSGAASFSRTNPNYVYGRSASHGNNQVITRADIATQPATYTVVVDNEVLIPALVGAGTYLQDIFTGDDNSLTYMTGGEVGDFSHYVVHYPLGDPGAAQILDTNTRAAMFKTYGVGPDVHSATPDLSGRYAQITVSGYQSRSDYQYVWDTTLDTITEITVTPFGHGGLGSGWAVNQDTYTGTWDGLQWTWRSLSAPDGPSPALRNLIGTVLTPTEVFIAEHGNCNNNSAGTFLPYTSGTYRYYDGPYNTDNPPTSYLNTVAWRAWDDEIIQVPTDGLGGPVVRFAHHRSYVWPEPVAERQRPFEFWTLPKANVSPNGRWAAFTSNWEHTLGMDAYDLDDTATAGNKHRQDFFIVELITDGLPESQTRKLAFTRR